ncbi:MAG: hypothetical protein QF570_17620 [Myxococcota bacterium]|nr:hypothetical protein [Myxococcota bacterium]
MTQALDALAEPIQSFRSMLSNTSEQIRLMISTRVKRNGSSIEATRAEFGEFAAGRIDPERMAKVFSRVEPDAVDHGEVVARALDVCNELLARRENLFLVEVGEGGDLRAAVSHALADIGRAFAATRIVELVSQGSYREEEHAKLLEGHPFEAWSRAERKVGLGIVACVHGRDLRVGGLLDFLDRSFRLVLVVDGQAPPAPLVRLISPKVMVMQTADAGELEWIRRHDGPGVVALMPDDTARFRHDPDGGGTLAERMVITHLPEEKPRRLGVSSGFQQREDLEQLEALATPPEAVTQTEAPAPPAAAAEPSAPSASAASAPPAAEAPAATAPGDAADKLSAWLLEQTDLSGAS